MNFIKKWINNKSFGWLTIWAIGVSLVISGDSFGWNNGVDIGGPIGFLIAFIIISIFYLCIVRCNIELSYVFPNANNPSEFTFQAFGKFARNILVFFVCIEYIFSLPAIAGAIGEYVSILLPNSLNSKQISIIVLLIFCFLNMFKIEFSILVIFLLTFLAIFELILYSSVALPNFSIKNLQAIPKYSINLNQIFKSLPFAIWIYLGIEGISLSLKEVHPKNFKMNLTKGYYYSFITIFILTICVLIITAGSVTWTQKSWDSLVINNNHPIPYIIQLIYTKKSIILKLFTCIGLFGLIASLHGLIFASINLINFILNTHFGDKKNSRLYAGLFVLIIGIISLFGFNTDYLIQFSVFGALGLYIMNALSLLKLKFFNQNPTHKNIQLALTIFKNKNTLISIIIIFVLSIVSLISFIEQKLLYFVYFCAMFFVYIVLLKIKTKSTND